MEAAISGHLDRCLEARLNGQDPQAAPQAAPADWRDAWFIFNAPDISDETAAEITKAGAWPAFTAFFRLLWKRQREAAKAENEKALATCKAGILIGEGVRGLARSIGLSPKAMNRQLIELHRLGLLAVAKPPASIAKDAKGRIIRRPAHKGLVPASKIRFIGGDQHRRPANRQGSNRPLKVVGDRVSQGSNRPLKGRPPKGRFDTTPISPKNISPQEGGHADGIGRPSWGSGRLPAAGGEAPTLRPWTGQDHDRFEATKRRLADQAAGEAIQRAEADRIWRERQAAKAGAAAPQPAPAAPPLPDATEASKRLQEAVEDLPPASREKARKVGRKMTKAERKAEADARRLREIIERKRAGETGAAKADAEAKRQGAKEASRRARAAAREAVPAGKWANCPLGAAAREAVPAG